MNRWLPSRGVRPSIPPAVLREAEHAVDVLDRGFLGGTGLRALAIKQARDRLHAAIAETNCRYSDSELLAHVRARRGTDKFIA